MRMLFTLLLLFLLLISSCAFANTNLRIKALLTEFMNPEFEIENVRPYSPAQQEILRIYEEGVLSGVAEKDLPDDIASMTRVLIYTKRYLG